jgi:nicotinamide riboside kinase
MYKIAVIGPESTGKSALTKALALHYSAPHVDEYARSYVEELGRPYTYEDVCTIAKAQIAAEKLYATAAIASAEIPAVSPIDSQTEGFADKPAYVFFDTDLIITKVWMEYCYKQVPAFVNDQLKTGFFDLYLLCDTDLPWEPDPVREHGDDREYFFEWYRREVEQLNKPYVVIQGLGDERLNCAIQALTHHFQLKN